MLKIANAQAFWGDRCLAAAELIRQAPDLDFITMDYLAEVTMSILALQRQKDPTVGFAKDFVDVVRSLIPFWKEGASVRLIANAGGLNPDACAKACAEVLKQAGLSKKIAVVAGDDVLDQLRKEPSRSLYANLETQESFTTIAHRTLTANAYLGAEGITEALNQGGEIVITGRVADPSMVVGACRAHYGWSEEGYDRIAGATIAGHLIECGTQVTGGISTNWLALEDSVRIGYPIVEVDAEGHCVATKPEGTGGRVTLETVKEQLLYEIGDPDKYLSPDATVSFLGLDVQVEAKDRVRVTGARGGPPPSTYKVGATYQDGYRTEGTLALFGTDLKAKGKQCARVILERLVKQGYPMKRSHAECIGLGDLIPGIFDFSHEENVRECLLRIAVADPNKEAVEAFAKEMVSLVSGGPQGTTGYLTGRPKVRPQIAYWPCLIERDRVHAQVKFLGGGQ